MNSPQDTREEVQVLLAELSQKAQVFGALAEHSPDARADLLGLRDELASLVADFGDEIASSDDQSDTLVMS